MVDTVPQAAYDTAAAVFSRSFCFVEWKMLSVSPAGTSGFGDRGEPQLKAVKSIDRQKWIYVFRHNVAEQYAAIREEIRIDASGQMAATPYDQIEKEIDQRGTPVALGKTLCLPRRVFGKPIMYRFYASRVRLPLAQIKALEKSVTQFTPVTNLEPGKNSSVLEKNGEMLVPVVDPITVLLHLHAAYSAAADDVINYSSAHKRLSDAQRKVVERRRKKQLLASFLNAVIGEDNNTAGNNLVHQLKGQQGPLVDFLKHYDAQVKWRIDRRDRLGAYLTRWLQSEAMKIAAAAHLSSIKDAWPQFLVPWCHAVTRLCETPTGRTYLLSVLDEPAHFARTYVWPDKELSDDAFQAVRKGGMTVLEAYKSFAEARILLKEGDYVKYVVESVTRLRYLQRYKLAEKLTAQTIKEGVDLNRQIKETFAIDPDTYKAKTHFAIEARSLGVLIESINLLISVRTMMDAMKGKDPKAKQLAIVGLVGSGFDAAGAIASLFKKGEKIAAVFGFVSGVIDIYLGVEAMNQAFTDGDQAMANGSFLTAAGATISTAGAAMGLMAIPGGQIVGIIGLAVVAIGLIYKMLKGKTDLERFFAVCSWGVERKQDGGPAKGAASWSPTRFETWTGDKEFDYQLEALLNIICKITIARGTTFRDLKISMAWLPPRATLLVKYEESWQGDAKPYVLDTVVSWKDQGPVSKMPALIVAADGAHAVKVTAAAGQLPTRTFYTDHWVGPAHYRRPVASLKKSVASARLLVSFDGMAATRVPHDDYAQQTVDSSTMVLVTP
jgi:hypothetical protein